MRPGFPTCIFFSPLHLVIVKGDEVEIISDNAACVFESIEQQNVHPIKTSTEINLQGRFSRDEYIATVEQIQNHITRGDIYVTNFCQEFFAENATIDPLGVFLKLNTISPNPFAAFFKWKGNYILSLRRSVF